jgi:hypothetical protein
MKQIHGIYNSYTFLVSNLMQFDLCAEKLISKVHMGINTKLTK